MAMGFDQSSLEQISQPYYDHAIRSFLSPSDVPPSPEDGPEEKVTDDDRRVMEGLDRTVEQVTKIEAIEDGILPSSLFKNKKIVHKQIEAVSDYDSMINTYIDSYVDRINEDRQRQEDNYRRNQPRLLEYEVKEEKKDFPPFMKAKVTRYWASSSLVGRQKRYRCYNYRYCRYWRFCKYRKYCYNYYTYQNFRASNVLR